MNGLKKETMMNESERREWLFDLSTSQLMSLCYTAGLWNEAKINMWDIPTMVSKLTPIEGIEVPREGNN